MRMLSQCHWCTPTLTTCMNLPLTDLWPQTLLVVQLKAYMLCIFVCPPLSPQFLILSNRSSTCPQSSGLALSVVNANTSEWHYESSTHWYCVAKQQHTMQWWISTFTDTLQRLVKWKVELHAWQQNNISYTVTLYTSVGSIMHAKHTKERGIVLSTLYSTVKWGYIYQPTITVKRQSNR